MQLTQLISVFDGVLSEVDGRQLLEAYARLTDALTQAMAGEAGALALVQSRRDEVVTIHEALDGVFSAESTPILQQYNAHLLFGQPLIDQLNTAFVEHFMDPAAVLTHVADIVTATELFLAQIRPLREGLNPLTQEMPAVAEVIQGEYLDPATVSVNQPRTVFDNVKERLGLQPTSNSNAIVRANEPSLMDKAMVALPAALPIALAAAGKAVELYLNHQKKQTALITSPPTTQHPIRITKQDVMPNNTVRYYRYTRTVTTIIRNDD